MSNTPITLPANTVTVADAKAALSRVRDGFDSHAVKAFIAESETHAAADPSELEPGEELRLSRQANAGREIVAVVLVAMGRKALGL